ncbi:MAG: ABC transporter ATP-binding protein [Anaeroplasmataceae bacterium]
MLENKDELVLKVNNLTKRYKQLDVLSSVDYEVKNNKLIAFIGSNGAGKSTLLSLMTRTLERDFGNVTVEDKDILKWNQEELAKKISILRQSNSLSVRLTIYDLVCFGRYPYSKSRLKKEDHDIVIESIEYLGLEELKDRFLDELSGGQRQLAYIAMLLAQNTNFMFLDEPLNNLDMKHAKKIMQVLKRLVSEKGKTIIIVIHDINFASCYADYIVAMKDGKIFKEGNTSDVITEDVLKQIYDTDITIKEINNQKICIYY